LAKAGLPVVVTVCLGEENRMTILTFQFPGMPFATSTLIFVIFWEFLENLFNSMNAQGL
jgi:hypothetical protein